MSFRKWLQVLNKRSSKSRRRSAAGRRPRNCPALEQLEVRIQLSLYIVIGSGDGPDALIFLEHISGNIKFDGFVNRAGIGERFG